CTDGQREREQRDNRNEQVRMHVPCPVPKVLKDGFEPGEGVGVMGQIECESRAAKSSEGIGPRFFTAHACGAIRCVSRLHVIAQPLIDFAAKLFATKDVREAVKPSHVPSYVNCRTRATAPVKDAQFCSSSANCFRPEAVME